MNKNHADLSEERLNQLLSDIRAEAIPEFPHPPLASSSGNIVETALEKPGIAGASRRATRVERNHESPALRGSRRNDALKWSALVLSAVLVFVGFMVWPQHDQTAFGKVLQAMRSIRSVSYTVMDYHANGATFQTNVSIVGFSLTRADAVYASSTQITDWENKMQLTIDDRHQTATFRELDPSLESLLRRQQFVNLFLEIPENATQLIGPTTFQDRAADEYIVRFGERDFRVLVDAETMLPVQMTYEETSNGNPGFREVFQDFRFDADIDMSQFALRAPDGYAVQRIELKEPVDGDRLLVVSPMTGLDSGGVASVRFGASEQQILDFLGQPDIRKEQIVGGLQAQPTATPEPTGEIKLVTLEYNSRGLVLSLDSNGGLSSIRCLSQRLNGSSNRDFHGQTVQGIRIGDSYQKVLQTYGVPELQTNGVANFIRKGWLFHIRAGEVVGITVNEPTPDEFEITVDPDNGSWTIGTPTADE